MTIRRMLTKKKPSTLSNNTVTFFCYNVFKKIYANIKLDKNK